jgi:dCTP deaminase
MSVLVKSEIIQLIKEGKLAFEPGLDKWQLQPHSVDLRLGYTFLVPKTWEMTEEGRKAVVVDYLRLKDGRKYFDVIELEEGQYFALLPRENVIVVSLEKIKMSPGLMAVLYPRSSVNRRGLAVDLSGVVDAGYEGQLMVPLRNNTNSQLIRIYPGERFCQLVFQRLEREVRVRKSRWHGRDVAAGFVPERYSREISLVRRGKLRELKAKYGI